MSVELAVRGAALAVLLAALCGLFVAGGAGWPTPTSPQPSYEELDRNYDAHVEETAEISGTVVGTDPVVAEFGYDAGVFEEATYRLELTNAPPVEAGDNVLVYGELRPDRTVAVDAERTVVREPWERRYMFAVSLLAALLVAARLVNGWRLRPRKLRIVPRERSLYRRWRGDGDG
jgi:hypothetical protein